MADDERSDEHLDEAELLSFTQRLVRVRSVHDPAAGTAEEDAAEVVAEQMRQFGWQPQISEAAPGRLNVVAVIEGGAGPGRTLMFEGHTDVVTEGDRGSWSFDPYAGDVVEGVLRGRGSADMKGGLAAMIFATRAVELAGPFPGRIVVAALCDEEGLMLGAKHFAASTLASEVDGAICCEPEDGEICATSKGAIRLAIRLTGAMAHGAMPDHGRNPLPGVARVITGVERMQEQVRREHPEHPLLGPVHLTPTVALAGDTDQINVIPGTAVVCLDIRTIPGVDHPSLIARVGDLAREVAASCDLEAEVSVVDDRPVVDTPTDHPLVASLAAAHHHVTGEQARYGGVPGATDGTILSRDAGIATVVYGPGDKWIAHQSDEHLVVADLCTAARVYRECALRFLGANAPLR